MSGGETTGMPNTNYDLVSVLYHALQGAETYDQYIRDAKSAGDQELEQFLQDVQEENKRRAQRAQTLLAKRINQG